MRFITKHLVTLSCIKAWITNTSTTATTNATSTAATATASATTPTGQLNFVWHITCLKQGAIHGKTRAYFSEFERFPPCVADGGKFLQFSPSFIFKLCQKFAVTSENFLKTCIALEQLSCRVTCTRLLVLHEFACIFKYDHRSYERNLSNCA